MLVRILNGSLFELLQLAGTAQAWRLCERSEATQGFMTQAVIALSDTFVYPRPWL